MNLRSLVIVTAVALSSAALASAKTYDITLPAITKAGAVELQPGQYKVKIEGSQAVFTDGHNKSFTVPATVENGDRKFNYTSVETADHDGTNTVEAIEIGNSNTRLKLGQ
jgi:hypothetical protein